MAKPKRAQRRKPDTAKAGLEPSLAGSGGQGVHREVESEGHEEKYPVLLHQPKLAGKPLISHHVIINLIAATTTQAGLKVQAELDTRKYPPGRKLTRQEVRQVHLQCDSFHGEWNYTIHPVEEGRS